MARWRGSVIALLAAALVDQGTPAQGGEQIDRPAVPYFSFCRSNEMVGNAFYFSDTQAIAAGVARQDLQNSFHDFLIEKYQYPHASGVSCLFAINGDLRAKTETSRQQTITNLRSENYNVIETGWRYAN